jgi:hypothetical protein
MSEVDERIMWLATVICMPTRRDAVRAAFDRIIAIGRFRAVDMPRLPCTDHFPRGFAEWARRHDHPVLALAFDLVALSPDDASAVIHSAVSGAIGLLCSAYGDTSEARARLRVWDDVARGKHSGDDFSRSPRCIGATRCSSSSQTVNKENRCEIASAIRRSNC